MSSIDHIMAPVLGLLGAIVSVYLCYVLLRQILSWTKLSSSSMQAKKASRRAQQVDAFIEAKKFSEALAEIERAFVFDTANSTQHIAIAREHNQGLLNRCLVIADEMSGSLDSLPETERLILERAELQVLYLRTREAFQNLSKKREDAGKEMPSWTRETHAKKVEDVRAELQKNTRALQASLKQLFKDIRTPSTQGITYH